LVCVDDDGRIATSINQAWDVEMHRPFLRGKIVDLGSLFEVAKNGLALYLRRFADYDRVYGSLGAVVAFLLFVYVGANVVLFGAEIASEWPRIIHGHYDEELERMGVGSDPPSRDAPCSRSRA
jgi:uncharacterized BrkB/YihY/UPF0761 family membrane protein